MVLPRRVLDDHGEPNSVLTRAGGSGEIVSERKLSFLVF
jgi:hypothetical protein